MERYEIASCEKLIDMAQKLGMTDALALLELRDRLQCVCSAASSSCKSVAYESGVDELGEDAATSRR